MKAITDLAIGLLTGWAFCLFGALVVGWFSSTDYYRALFVGGVFVMIGIFTLVTATLEALDL